MTFEFLFDFVSPASYLAHKRLPELASRTGATPVYVPVLLGGIFKEAGTTPPISAPAKAHWFMRDMLRCAERQGTPFILNPHHPFRTVSLMRGAVALQGTPKFLPYVDALFDAAWAEGRDLGDPAEVAAILRPLGIDEAEFAAMTERPEVKEGLFENTRRAVSRGVFGLPTFFVGDELFFGQDRLDHVEDALARGPASGAGRPS